MTEVMAQSGYGLSASSTRQDIVSALLDGYGNDFASPHAYSPDFKELPPPPPEKDDKSVSMMNMRFQLRIDEPSSPLHYNGNMSPPLESSPPTKIVCRSLSRSSKPRSLKLAVSNGSTAVVPPTPSLPTPSAVLPSSTDSKPLPVPVPEPVVVEERPLPPPPPEKSTRRQQQPVMGGNQSKNRRERKDSVESKDEVANRGRSETSEASPVVKRKAVPKFKSLADLGVGPRGGKNGPLPPIAPAKNKSNESVATITPASVAQERAAKASNRSHSVEEVSRKPLPAPRPTVSAIEARTELPPTPDEQLPGIPPPAPPKKVFGLPSNPRARNQETPTSAKHIRGKSSTGYDLMSSKTNTKPLPSPARSTNLTTMTPGPTPSPNKTMAVGAQGSTFPNIGGPGAPESPASPVSIDEASRPFSFEPLQKQSQPPSRIQSTQSTSTSSNYSISPKEVIPSFPPRTTSRPTGQPQTFPQQPNPSPPTQFRPQAQPQPQAQQPLPSRSPSPPNADVAPIVIRAAPITDKHTQCYASHSTFVWSINKSQPMPCMVCHENSTDRKWACTWCYLRVCIRCSEELVRAPGRDLRTVIERCGRTPEEAELQDAGARARSREGDREEEARSRSGSRGSGRGDDGRIPRLVALEEEEDKMDFS